MVNAVTSTPKQRTSQNPKRPPLLPSESNNAPPRRPKGREVTSRYLSLSTSSSSSSSNSSSSTNTTSSSITSGSSISSRRSQSPMLGSKAAITTPKSQQRAVSAERRRPAASTPSSAERMLVTSMRSLSVSFQGESYSIPVSKVKPPPAAAGTPAGLRKGTPERRKAGVTPVRDQKERDRENSRPIDQQHHRWPARLRGENSNFLTRSLDYGTDKVKLSGSSSSIRDLRRSMEYENNRNKVPTELKLENNVNDARDMRLGQSWTSDVDSVSSESTGSGNASQLRGGPRGVVVSARIWQDGSNRVHKVLDSGSPVYNSSSNRAFGTSKLAVPKKFQNDSPVSSPRDVLTSRGLSPHRGGVRAASPSKALNSSSGALLRGMASPLRGRIGIGNSMNDNNTCGTPSMLSFPGDLRRGKLGENRIADANDLRLLYNRLLQWRLANAKLENTSLVQQHTVEKSLYNARMTISKLLDKVSSKRIELQLLRHNLKLCSILKDQEPYLESWALCESDNCNSVSAAVKALEASTIRLPIVGGARANIHKVQEAISSAVDMMQAMASSICSLLPKVEHVNGLVSELSNLSAREHHLLDQCRDILSTTFIPLQVTHCSLRTHVLQVQCAPASLTKKVTH